jgi:hypothetical protein
LPELEELELQTRFARAALGRRAANVLTDVAALAIPPPGMGPYDDNGRFAFPWHQRASPRNAAVRHNKSSMRTHRLWRKGRSAESERQDSAPLTAIASH